MPPEHVASARTMNNLTGTSILALSALLAALPSCQSYYGQTISRQTDGLTLLNAALGNVHDKTSADAAAIEVDRYGTLLMQDVRGLLAHGKPNLLELYLLKNSYQDSNLKPMAKQTLAQLFRLYGQGFYGSAALRQSFVNQLTKL